MNFRLKPALTLALLATGLTLTSQAAPRSGISDLVHRLDGQAAEFRQEINEHYKHSGAYRHLAEDANKIYREVEHLDELVHQGASSDHFRTDLADLDRIIAHVHQVIDQIEEGTYGHVHGSVDHVHDIVTSMSETVDRLRGMMSYGGHSRDRSHEDYGDRGRYESYRGRGNDHDHDHR